MNIFRTIKGYIIIEILASFYFILILFKIFAFEIIYLNKKMDILFGLKQYNDTYYTIHYISNKLFGICDIYKKQYIFQGRKNYIIFFQFSQNKFNKFLRHKNIYYFYWDDFKIKEISYTTSNTNLINYSISKILCNNIDCLKFSYYNNLCFKWQYSCSIPSILIKISVNFFLFDKIHTLSTTIQTSIK